jgi:hydrogenase maturation protease
VTVVGLGSPFGDDRLGWCVAEKLAARVPPNVARILLRDRPGPALLDEIAGRRASILIDAADTGASPGTISCLSAADVGSYRGACSSHDLRLGESLALGQALGILPPLLHLYLVAIDPSQAVEPDAPLTPPVAAAACDLTGRLAALLPAWRA